MGAIRDHFMGNTSGGGLGAGSFDNTLAEERPPRQAIDATRPDSYEAETAVSGAGGAGRDPIETLRERIANELMRALNARESNAGDGSPSPQLGSPASPTANSGAFGFMTALDGTNSLSSAAGALAPEGSFQRFLHDTNVDLRATLNERANLRREARSAVPIVVPPAQGEGEGASSIPTEGEAIAESTADSPSDPTSDTPQTPTRLVHRPAEGVIEPRLNWWRM